MNQIFKMISKIEAIIIWFHCANYSLFCLKMHRTYLKVVVSPEVVCVPCLSMENKSIIRNSLKFRELILALLVQTITIIFRIEHYKME